jgi:hypothetical protein
MSMFALLDNDLCGFPAAFKEELLESAYRDRSKCIYLMMLASSDRAILSSAVSSPSSNIATVSRRDSTPFAGIPMVVQARAAPIVD